MACLFSLCTYALCIGAPISDNNDGIKLLRKLEKKLLAEIGIDIREQTSKLIDDINTAQVGTVIMLCTDVCLMPPSGARHLLWPLHDPLRKSDEDRESMFHRFREIRAGIELKIREFAKSSCFS